MEGHAVKIGYNLVDGDWRCSGSPSVRFWIIWKIALPGEALSEEGLNQYILVIKKQHIFDRTLLLLHCSGSRRSITFWPA